MTTITTRSVKCPQCRYQLDRDHIRNICEDTAKIMRIPEEQLYRNIHQRSHILGKCVWIYEGRNNGWWYYDYEMQDMLENAWLHFEKTKSAEAEAEPAPEWYICGQRIYIDFENMEQINCNNNAVRAIRRVSTNDIDTCGLLIKGVAGMM